MTKYTFKCFTCKTTTIIETPLPDDMIHKAPPCPCGKSRMEYMSSIEYAIDDSREATIKETNLGIQEMEDPDFCLCLDCTIAKNGL